MSATRSTVSIANAHDGVALTAEEADCIASLLIGMARHLTYPDRKRVEQLVHVLRGKRRDGSEPETRMAAGIGVVSEEEGWE